jgi:hypothetical protein
LDLPSNRGEVRAPRHEHAKSTGITYGRRKRRTDDATTHGSLNDRQFNAKPVAKGGLHLPRSKLMAI